MKPGFQNLLSKLNLYRYVTGIAAPTLLLALVGAVVTAAAIYRVAAQRRRATPIMRYVEQVDGRLGHGHTMQTSAAAATVCSSSMDEGGVALESRAVK